MRQVLAALKTPISRSRLMLIAGKRRVPLHDDVGYHWYRRMRVHIPIITNPGVQFCTAGRIVHMKAGETWIFDNFHPHAVFNSSEQPRIHLVVDTPGSPEFSGLINEGHWLFSKNRGERHAPAKLVAYRPTIDAGVELEQYRYQMLSSDEFGALLNDVLTDAGQAIGNGEALAAFSRGLEEFRARWDKLLETHGHSADGASAYHACIGDFVAWVTRSEIHGAPWERFATKVLRTIKEMLTPKGDRTFVPQRSPGRDALRVLQAVTKKSNRVAGVLPDQQCVRALAELRRKFGDVAHAEPTQAAS
jgi:hypothetical protein